MLHSPPAFQFLGLLSHNLPTLSSLRKGCSPQPTRPRVKGPARGPLVTSAARQVPDRQPPSAAGPRSWQQSAQKQEQQKSSRSGSSKPPVKKGGTIRTGAEQPLDDHQQRLSKVGEV